MGCQLLKGRAVNNCLFEMRKIFNETDGAYGQVGEIATKAFFESIGFRVTHLPDGKYGCDIYCESNTEKFFCGTELRTKTGSWSRDREVFPYATYNFMERRAKSDESLLVCWREDMQRGIVIFGCDVKHFDIVEITNRYASKEDMRQIPIQRCLPIAIDEKVSSPVAFQNAERIRKAIRDKNIPPRQKLRYLEPSIPYGIDEHEYRRLLDECGQAIIAPTTVTAKPRQEQFFLF